MASDQKDPVSILMRARMHGRALRDAYRSLDARTHHVIGIVLKIMLAGYFAFCALFLTARHVIWPHIENYKKEIELVASKAVGNPVSIAGMRAAWDGLNPRLILDQVVVRDKNNRQALTLPEVSATLSWWSVLTFDLRFNHLEIRHPDLDIRRDAQGNFYIAGLLFDSTASKSDGRGADWVLSQDEITIVNGRLRWTDEMRKAPELALEDVNIALQNGWWSHRLMMKAKPPATLAAPIEALANFRHPFFASRISDVRQWRGELFVDLQNTDLAAWKAYFDYPFEVSKGYGSVRAWLTFDHAHVADFTADLALSDVVTRLRKDLELLDLLEVSGRIAAREDHDPGRATGTLAIGTQGHTVALSGFTLKTRGGLILPETTIAEEFTPARGNAPEKTIIRARQMDLQAVAQFLKYLPFTTDLHQMLADFAPSGQLKDFSVQWEGDYPDMQSYLVSGQFVGLSLKAQPPRAARPASGKKPAQAAIPGIPGFENLSGRIHANHKGGNFTLDSEKLALHFPGYFSESAMSFESLKMQASWAFLDKTQQLRFDIGKMAFVHEGMSGSLSGRHIRPLGTQDRSAGSLDLKGQLSGFDVTRVGRYLPLQTSESLRKWLGGALEEGQAKDVQFRVKGNLADFPFTDRRKGEFSVTTRIENGKLNYAPGQFAKDGKSPIWPQAEKIQGRLSVNGSRMEIWADTAETAGVALNQVSAVIPDILSADRQLEIAGHAVGSLQGFVDYTKASPVADWIGNLTEDTEASGNAILLLKFQMPLDHAIDTKVQGTLRFDNNDVTLFKSMPVLSKANGSLEFYERGFRLHDIGVGFLGGKAVISGGTQASGKFQVRAAGNLTVDGVRKAFPGMSGRIAGKTNYTVQVNQKGRLPEVVVESALRGVTLDFPAPLRKGANDEMPLRVYQVEQPASAGGGLRDEIRVTLGSAIAARYTRQKPAGKGGTWQVVRGGIGVNVPPPEPATGVAVKVAMNTIDVDLWRSVLGTAIGPPQARTPASSDRIGLSQYIDPDSFSAKTPKLTLSGMQFDAVDLHAEQRKDSWQIGVKSDQVSGTLNWIAAGSKQKQDRLAARLTALKLSTATVSGTSDFLESPGKPTRIPDLDIVAENFEIYGKKLGRLELVASNTPAAVAREWQIHKLQVANPDATLNSSGKWNARKGANVTSVTYNLDVANAGRLLDRIGFAGVLRDGRGKMEGSLEWKAPPFALHKPSLSGDVTLSIDKGQFLKADPGVARLLGVMSLQTLPRRLQLDFRDIFSPGYAFDKVSATANIANGTIKTDNLKMLGASSTVLMEGSADIVNETQNLHVVVIPDISPNVASAVYGAIVNPVIGVGAVIAQLLLRAPLAKVLTYEYQIAGSWEQPTITPMNESEGAGKAPPSPAKKTKKGAS